MQIKAAIGILALSLGLAACGGGGGGSSTGLGQLTPDQYAQGHAALAAEFVERLRMYEGRNMTLVKTDTDKSGYIVVRNDNGSYSAYYIDGWEKTVDFEAYFSVYPPVHDLSVVAQGRFSNWTGLVFEETQSSSKDLQKIAAFKQSLKLKQAADILRAEFGLSDERAMEVARLSARMAMRPKASVPTRDWQAFSQELLGSSAEDIRRALVQKIQGEPAAYNQVIDKAARVNGVGPEHMNQIIESLF